MGVSVMTTYSADDLELEVARYADSDWVDAQFAAIIAANWPGRPGLAPQRLRVALAVRAYRDDGGGEPRSLSDRIGRPRRRPIDPEWPRERSPPRTTTGQR